MLAVDIPSGVGGDTGEVSGRAWPAERTVTFAALKPGLLQADGIELAGRVDVADIGLVPAGAHAHLVEDADISRLVPARRRDGNKWTSAVLVVAGSPGMTGAAGLCARAASRAGAGMVRLGVPGAAPGSPEAPEAVGVSLPAEGWATEALAVLERCRAVVVGPGLGRDESVAADVRRLVAESPVPVVIDADGLFALGALDCRLSAGAGTVLTPHDGEYRRLAGTAPGRDRLAAARSLAGLAGGVALVKGSTTTVAGPDDDVLVSTAGSSRLATAGTGDVLSGVIGALLARGVPAAAAAGLAAHVHGRAASMGRPEGLVAGDLPDLVADVLSRLGPGAPGRSDEPPPACGPPPVAGAGVAGAGVASGEGVGHG